MNLKIRLYSVVFKIFNFKQVLMMIYLNVHVYKCMYELCEYTYIMWLLGMIDCTTLAFAQLDL